MNEPAMLAVAALREEIDAAIADIRTDRGMSKCAAHDAMARGLIVVLRVQRAQLDWSLRSIMLASGAGAIVGGIASITVAIIQRLI